MDKKTLNAHGGHEMFLDGKSKGADCSHPKSLANAAGKRRFGIGSGLS
jgi:hypothetical protein